MQLFKLKTRLSKFDHFADFAREFKLSEHDLVITNEFLYEPFMKSLNLPCHFIILSDGSPKPNFSCIMK